MQTWGICDQQQIIQAFCVYDLFKLAEVEYSEQIASIKEIFDGSTIELPASWPDRYFKDVLKSVLVDTGIVNSEPNKAELKRTALHQQQLGEFMQRMVPLWLRVRAVLELSQMDEHVSSLGFIAQIVENATVAVLQKRKPDDPVFCGALCMTDVIFANNNNIWS